jgi:hypothetical protein
LLEEHREDIIQGEITSRCMDNRMTNLTMLILDPLAV